jgi:hypothetical protein
MIEYSKVKGTALYDALKPVEKALEHLEPTVAIMACIAAAVMIQDPNLSGAKLASTIKTISEYMALALSANYEKPTIN